MLMHGILANSLTATNMWATAFVVVLSILLYLLVQTRKINATIRAHPQGEEVANLVETHYNTRWVAKYIGEHLPPAHPEDQKSRAEAIRKLSRCEKSIDQYFSRHFGVNSIEDNAFLVMARHYRDERQIGRAIFYYTGALRLSTQEFYLTPDELADCYRELQKCYLIAWRTDHATMIAREARTREIKSCISELRVRKYSLVFCVCYGLQLMAADALSIFTSQNE